MNTAHYYTESNRPSVCLFCGGPPEHPHLAPLPLSFVAPVAPPCPDCLKLAKVLIRMFPPGNLIHDDLDAFINDAQAWSRVYQADAKKYAAERDAAVAQVTNRDCQIIALRAERDRLAGVVERVKDLHRWLKESGTHANEALNLGNVLAEPVRETFTRLNSYGVPYESRNGRGLTGHDARGRRHEDTHNCVRYTPLTWDRRKANRRA